jgi:sulfite reductase (NADPH) flavoprotein alpha-component
MPTNIPHIPENAPFTPEQRAWLNGFLAGLYSSEPEAKNTKKLPLNIAVYFATQSGVAERLAKKMAKALKADGHHPTIASLEQTTPAEIAMQSTALFLASTYGEGDPPDAAKTFRDLFFADGAPRLETLRYSVFCLGDRTYEEFCKFGIDLDDRLSSLGAVPLVARVESDVDVDQPFDVWQQDVVSRLGAKDERPSPQLSISPASPDRKESSQPLHSRENPFHAKLLERQPLTTDISSKLTMHLSFSLEDAPLQYEAGDACGVIANNDPILVGEILSSLPFSGGEMVAIPKAGETTIEEALLHHLQPTRLTRKIVSAFAHKANCKTLSALLPPEQGSHLDAYIYDRGLIDLLHEYPGIIQEAQELVEILPRLSPRLYSISSSPAAHGREVHCTIAVVRYRSHNRERGGIASTMLSDRAAVGSRTPIYIQPNKRFRLPSNGDTPIIMIGPGTGIAPFRAFLHERQALGNRGKNWLFFGERSAKTDFLYCRELSAMCDNDHLTRLDTAFSRDQAHKVYVQDRMIETGAQLWQWLEEGAQLYVCGDASRMAKDVHAALHQIVEKHGGKSIDAAREYVSQLQEDHRYHRDVY